MACVYGLVECDTSICAVDKVSRSLINDSLVTKVNLVHFIYYNQNLMGSHYEVAAVSFLIFTKSPLSVLWKMNGR